MSLWTEVKQRRITQIVVAYVAGGWMALAVIDQFVDREILPPVAYQVGLTIYLVGILAALVVGWYHGEKGEQKATRSEIVLLIMIAIVGVAASGFVVQRSSRATELADALSSEDLRRIGVLYFDDMSRDGSMQAVADGITEGLINRLTEVRGLDITSRNGSREARSLGSVSADSIATVLDVGALVDGTVDKAGDQIRVSIRLLDGVSGTPLFQETRSWPEDQVATIDTELATSLTDPLRESLGEEIRLRQRRAEGPNPAAWLQVARAERYMADASEAIQAGDPHAVTAAFEAADRELVGAQESAPEWAEPLVLRGEVAYESYILAHDIEDLTARLSRAVEHADAALALEPNNAAALELRGTANYRHWLFVREEDERVRENLFASARADLERAETLAPSRASVKATLSHLYNQVDEWTLVAIRAREAYDLDAFLDTADEVLWRLFTAYYDLNDHHNAESTCERGRERFEQDFRFVQCSLLLMTMPSVTPDVDRAWALYDELQPLLVERPEFFDAQARIMIGAIFGRSGLADSAQKVLSDARVSPDIDPEYELLSFEAAMRSVMDDVDGSLDALSRFVVLNGRSSAGEHWWWRNVASNPEFARYRDLH